MQLVFPKASTTEKNGCMNLNCSIGGYPGLMGTFRWFAEAQPPENVYQLYLLGPGGHSVPHQDVVSNGVKRLNFQLPPSGSFATAPNMQALQKNKRSRVHAREIVSYSPSAFTSVCLASGWKLSQTKEADCTVEHMEMFRKGKPICKVVFAGSGLLQQDIFEMGGFLLYYHSFSPDWLGKGFKGDEGNKLAHQFLRLCTFSLRKNEAFQKQFHDLGSAAFKHFFFNTSQPLNGQ